jgi:hypothetical protein
VVLELLSEVSKTASAFVINPDDGGREKVCETLNNSILTELYDPTFVVGGSK